MNTDTGILEHERAVFRRVWATVDVQFVTAYDDVCRFILEIDKSRKGRGDV